MCAISKWDKDVLIHGPDSYRLELFNSSFEFNRAKFRLITAQHITDSKYVEMKNRFAQKGDTVSELVGALEMNEAYFSHC